MHKSGSLEQVKKSELYDGLKSIDYNTLTQSQPNGDMISKARLYKEIKVERLDSEMDLKNKANKSKVPDMFEAGYESSQHSLVHEKPIHLECKFSGTLDVSGRPFVKHIPFGNQNDLILASPKFLRQHLQKQAALFRQEDEKAVLAANGLLNISNRAE